MALGSSFSISGSFEKRLLRGVKAEEDLEFSANVCS